MNLKVVEGMLAGFIRLVPPNVWAELGAKFDDLLAIHRSIDERLARLEAQGAERLGRLDDLESIVRNCVPDAGAAFAERDMYLPDRRDTVAGIPISDISMSPAPPPPDRDRVYGECKQ